jgi:hypothetical protein
MLSGTTSLEVLQLVLFRFDLTSPEVLDVKWYDVT